MLLTAGCLTAGRPAHARRRVHAPGAAAASPAAQTTQPLRDSGTAALLACAARLGVRHDALAPASFDGLRGLAATRRLQPGDAVAVLPHSAVLEVTSAASVPQEGLPAGCDAAAYRATAWWGRLALRLLASRAAGAASPLAAYVAALPPRLPVPARWSRDWPAYRSLPAHVRARAESGAEAVRAAHARLFPAAAPPGHSLAEWEWAVECVRSRTFSGPYEGSSAGERRLQALLVAALLLAYTLSGAGPPENGAAAALSSLLFVFVKDAATAALPDGPRRYVLVPLLDLANHSSRAISDLAYEYFQDEFSLISGAETEAGQQAFVSYGPLDLESQLILYGFVERDNAHDALLLTGLAGTPAAAALSAEELAGLTVDRDGGLAPAAAAAKLTAALGAGGAAAAVAAAVAAAYPPGEAAAAEAAAEAAAAAARRGRDRGGDVRSDEEREAAALAAALHASKHVTARAVLASLAAGGVIA